MAARQFTNSDVVDMSNERGWAANLGMLDWDNTKIVFTKRTLVEFLKYTGITVDPNYTNISKLPRYAEFGKLSDAPPPNDGNDEDSGAQEQHEPFRPSRRVRTAPGGSSSNIFEEEFGDDALSQAPVKSPVVTEPEADQSNDNVDPEPPVVGSFRPSRRVRTGPGGKDSLADILGGIDPVEEFKPTRKVRQQPGGRDNISEIF